jgi:hypothetical protein
MKTIGLTFESLNYSNTLRRDSVFRVSSYGRLDKASLLDCRFINWDGQAAVPFRFRQEEDATPSSRRWEGSRPIIVCAPCIPGVSYRDLRGYFGQLPRRQPGHSY